MDVIAHGLWGGLPFCAPGPQEIFGRVFDRYDPKVARERFEKSAQVLEIEKAEAMWARKPTATIVRP